MVFSAIAGEGGMGDSWSTWIRETENLGDFIKTFTNGVVSCGTNDFEMIMSVHFKNLSMATGNDEREKRENWQV